MSDEEYCAFLTDLFDCYKTDMLSGKYVYIRRFENWRGMLAGYEPEECCLSGRCTPEIVVEADGSVYPCDFYCTDEFRLGNVNSNTIAELLYSTEAMDFCKRQARTNEKCRACKWGRLCRGGCPREKNRNINAFRYCNATYTFLENNMEELKLINRKI